MAAHHSAESVIFVILSVDHKAFMDEVRCDLHLHIHDNVKCGITVAKKCKIRYLATPHRPSSPALIRRYARTVFTTMAIHPNYGQQLCRSSGHRSAWHKSHQPVRASLQSTTCLGRSSKPAMRAPVPVPCRPPPLVAPSCLAPRPAGAHRRAEPSSTRGSSAVS
eukprot:6209184-Pleurochrysis_carterae.AAC.3